MPRVQQFSNLGSVGVHTRSRLLHAAAPPRGSLTPAEAPLIEAGKLFRHRLQLSGWSILELPLEAITESM